jgi:signal transduction histidine kinase
VTIAAADVAGILTTVVILVPSLHYAYRSASLHATLDTAAGMVALLAAYLVLGRYRRSHLRDDLVLVAGLAALAVSNFVFAAAPWALAGEGALRFATWMTLIGTLAGSLLLVSAAFSPASTVERPVRSLALSALAVTVYFVCVGVVVARVADRLPLGIDPRRPPPGEPWPVGGHAVLAAQLVAALAFGLAAVGFTRRADRGDDLMTWFGSGAALAAFARVNYALFPSLYSEWVYIGDALRLGSYVLILIGAGREIGRYQTHVVEAATLEERRRIARDLHDGLAQEVAFIAARGRTLRRRVELLRLAPDPEAFGRVAPELDKVSAAAERALDESRRAIAALTHPIDEPLDVTLVQTVEEIVERNGTEARLVVEQGVRVPPKTREALLRIAREAVTNASRHGGAKLVTVELSNRDDVRLRILDDGCGFDVAAATAERAGFGLVTMRERAAAVGAELRIRSDPATGTEIEVVLP